jgi:hypothetical protein
MAFRKLTRAFNRAVTHGGYLATAAALSLGIGIGADINHHAAWETQPPAANVEMHAAALNRLHRMSDDIVNAQYKIDFAARSIATAQQTLGQQQDAKSMGENVDALQAAFDKNQDARQTQQERLALFRKEVLLNPSLSEKEANDIYVALWDKAKDNQLGDIQNYFSPFSDALKMRDETIARLHLPRDAAKVSDAQAEQLVAASRAAADDIGTEAAEKGLIEGLETLGGLLSLSALGAFGRARQSRAPGPTPEKNDAQTLRISVTRDDRKKRDRNGDGFAL